MAKIKDILGPKFETVTAKTFQKFYNNTCYVLAENNKNIIVFDKKNSRLYTDLKQAHLALTNFKKLA
jgi:hypothetical protein